MLTVMCPNCRHRFPAPGCCNPGPQEGSSILGNQDDRNHVVVRSSDYPITSNVPTFYGGGYLLVPREYSENNAGCFINAPTIIHGPTIIQQQPSIMGKALVQRASGLNENSWLRTLNDHQENSSNTSARINEGNIDSKPTRINEFSKCQINTTCDLTGGTVTITTPSIQSGGCLIQSKDSEIVVQAPRVEIGPKLSSGGGGCFVQTNFPLDGDTSPSIYRENDRRDESPRINERSLYTDSCNIDEICLLTPSGCQELPGTRRFISTRGNLDNYQLTRDSGKRDPRNERDFFGDPSSLNEAGDSSFSRNEIKKRHSTCCCASKTNDEDFRLLKSLETTPTRPLSSAISRKDPGDSTKTAISNDSTSSMEIRVNATVQLPPNVGHCTVNITATTGNSSGSSNSETGRIGTAGRRDNFNGGGLVTFDGTSNETTSNERRDDAPTTPVSWVMPCPWGFVNYPIDKDVTRLAEIKRLLQTSGWYHEGLSWQQSETLLKTAPPGRWLMRDSSDSRFVFAVSVQTARGPTSVRVHYFLGRFRLDAEPRLSLAMPLFDCPIKMLQHYVDYSKRIDEHRKEVWVDYSGQLYSQIYLTKPLVREVRTLSHLARIVVNSNKLNTGHLPPLIKNYLAEYPYSL